MEINRHTPVDDLPEMCRVEEVAAWLDVSRGLVFEMVKRNDLPHIKLGRLIRVPREALAAFKNPSMPMVARLKAATH